MQITATKRQRLEIAKDVEDKVRNVVYLLAGCDISSERAVEAICIFIAGNETELPEREIENGTSK